MDFTITDEQDELRRSVREVLAKECPADLVRQVVEQGTGADGLWASMVQLGWPALAIPEAHGGLGFGFVELTLICEELGRAAAPGPFLSTVTQFAPVVREAAGDDAEAAGRWLGAVAAGEATGTLAVADAAGRWGLDAVTGTAKPDGDDWVLDAAKAYVVDGADAHEVVVAVRVPSAGDGIGLFVVPGDGIDRHAIEPLDASRRLATLQLNGVRVSADRVLGKPGQGDVPLRRALEEATVALAAETLGACQTVLDMTVDYGKVREQFGVPIGSFQAVKHQLADAHVAVEQARSTTYFAAMCIAEEDERRGLATSMAKVAAGGAQRLAGHVGIQLHGGIGYTWEHDVHLFVKRAKAGDALLGTAAQHRARVADLLQI